jgi:sulfur-oxidizing protein SoxB
VNEDTEGPQIWDVVENYIRRQETISVEPNSNVEVVGL